jgi:hypothetical protein
MIIHALYMHRDIDLSPVSILVQDWLSTVLSSDHFAIMADSKHKPCSVRNWNGVREKRSKSLDPGPTSAEAIGDWPSANAKCIHSSGKSEDEEMTLRLFSILQGGLLQYGDYSGIEAARHALDYSVKGMAKEMGWTFEEWPITYTRSCDKGKLQTEVLTKYALTIDGGRSCHFKNMLDRLPEAARNYVTSNMPPKTASNDDKLQAAQQLEQFVQSNKEWMFPADAKSWCSVHGKDCLAFPTAVARGELRKRKAGVATCMGSSRLQS